MQKTPLKIAALTVIALAFTTGSAFAGDGKDCDHKKKTAMKTQTSTMATPQTAVLSAAERGDAMTKTAKKTYSFDDALRLCQEKGVADIQACVDYKTGKTQPKS